jgi:hypothetical protein
MLVVAMGFGSPRTAAGKRALTRWLSGTRTTGVSAGRWLESLTVKADRRVPKRVGSLSDDSDGFNLDEPTRHGQCSNTNEGGCGRLLSEKLLPN